MAREDHSRRGGHCRLPGEAEGTGGLWGTWHLAEGVGAGGSGQGGDTFCCTVFARFPNGPPTSENVSRSWDRGYTCPNRPNCQHPEFPPSSRTV